MTEEVYWPLSIRPYLPHQVGYEIDYAKEWWDHPLYGKVWLPLLDPGEVLYTIQHYWGTRTICGDWGSSLDRTFATCRAGESYHIYQKGWNGIAYTALVPPHRGSHRVIHGRGFRPNGGQKGAEWNSHSWAIACPVGADQPVRRSAKVTMAMVALESPAGIYMGHRDTGTSAECPGPVIYPWMTNDGWVEVLGVMRVGTFHRRVRSLRVALWNLGYDTGVGWKVRRVAGRPVRMLACSRMYNRALADQVRAFQSDYGITVDGKAGPETLLTIQLAKEETK